MICVDLLLGIGVCYGLVDIMIWSSYWFLVGYRLMMLLWERLVIVVMIILDKRMVCCSIGWINIMVVYELEEIVKWKVNSCS